MDGIIILLVSSLMMSLVGAVPAVQVVPQGIESVNGSNITMGCASPLVDRGGVMVCNNKSYLVDGCSPTINTSTSNWASQLVTVRKNEENDAIHYEHNVLIFDFDTAVSPDSIELDLFPCPEWNIGAPGIYVYGYQNSTLVFNPDMGEFIAGTLPSQSQSSCDSLSTVHIGLGGRVISSYHSLHILVDFTSEETEWVYVGEVRFFSANPIDIASCHRLLTEVIHTTPAGTPMNTFSAAITMESQRGSFLLQRTLISVKSSTTHISLSNNPATTERPLKISVSSGSLSSTPITSRSDTTKHSNTSDSSASLSSTPTVIQSTQCELVCIESCHIQVQSSLVPVKRENDPGCSSALIGVSAAALLMTVTLTIIIITQCLLMVRMRKSKDLVQRNETYTEVMTPTTMKSDVPVTPNEVYALHKIAYTSEEAVYEIVK